MHDNFLFPYAGFASHTQCASLRYQARLTQWPMQYRYTQDVPKYTTRPSVIHHTGIRAQQCTRKPHLLIVECVHKCPRNAHYIGHQILKPTTPQLALYNYSEVRNPLTNDSRHRQSVLFAYISLISSICLSVGVPTAGCGNCWLSATENTYHPRSLVARFSHLLESLFSQHRQRQDYAEKMMILICVLKRVVSRSESCIRV